MGRRAFVEERRSDGETVRVAVGDRVRYAFGYRAAVGYLAGADPRLRERGTVVGFGLRNGAIPAKAIVEFDDGKLRSVCVRNLETIR